MHLLIINIIGIVNWLVVFLPAAFIAAGIGSLLFWVQHNFEDTYYVDTEHWQYEKVGLKGSSYLKLPQPLTWITAHIGLHHIHHLNYKIPNYYLESARKAHPDLVSIQPLTYKSFRECFKKVFWNTHLQKMVSLDD